MMNNFRLIRQSGPQALAVMMMLLLALACGGKGASSPEEVTLRIAAKPGDEIRAYALGSTDVIDFGSLRSSGNLVTGVFFGRIDSALLSATDISGVALYPIDANGKVIEKISATALPTTGSFSLSGGNLLYLSYSSNVDHSFRFQGVANGRYLARVFGATSGNLLEWPVTLSDNNMVFGLSKTSASGPQLNALGTMIVQRADSLTRAALDVAVEAVLGPGRSMANVIVDGSDIVVGSSNLVLSSQKDYVAWRYSSVAVALKSVAQSADAVAKAGNLLRDVALASDVDAIVSKVSTTANVLLDAIPAGLQPQLSQKIKLSGGDFFKNIGFDSTTYNFSALYQIAADSLRTSMFQDALRMLNSTDLSAISALVGPYASLAQTALSQYSELLSQLNVSVTIDGATTGLTGKQQKASSVTKRMAMLSSPSYTTSSNVVELKLNMIRSYRLVLLRGPDKVPMFETMVITSDLTRMNAKKVIQLGEMNAATTLMSWLTAHRGQDGAAYLLSNLKALGVNSMADLTYSNLSKLATSDTLSSRMVKNINFLMTFFARMSENDVPLNTYSQIITANEMKEFKALMLALMETDPDYAVKAIKRSSLVSSATKTSVESMLANGGAYRQYALEAARKIAVELIAGRYNMSSNDPSSPYLPNTFDAYVDQMFIPYKTGTLETFSESAMNYLPFAQSSTPLSIWKLFEPTATSFTSAL